MLWEAKGSECSPESIGSMIPERVLFEYEGPRTFLSRDPDGELLLAHQCGESDAVWRYVVVPFSDRLVAEIEEGRLDLHAALDQPRLWIADIGSGGKVIRCVKSTLLAVPEKCLPRSGVMLYPEHEPLLSVRSTGRNVEMGKATLGELRASLDNVRWSLKTLAEAAKGDVRRRGQPSAATRRYYDLPALLLVGSVRVVVLPEQDPQRHLFELDEVWQKMADILQRGLQVAFSPESDVPSDKDDPELAAAIEAVYALSPPAHGHIDRTEITGRLAPQSSNTTPVVITREMRASIRQRLLRESESVPEYVQETGQISELDLEESTCHLRDMDGQTLRKLSFEDGFFDDIKQAFDSQQAVRVVAEVPQHGDTSFVLAVTFLDQQALDEKEIEF